MSSPVSALLSHYTPADFAILSRVHGIVRDVGAASVERLQALTSYDVRTLQWAVFNLQTLGSLECTAAQLWIVRH